VLLLCQSQCDCVLSRLADRGHQPQLRDYDGLLVGRLQNRPALNFLGSSASLSNRRQSSQLQIGEQKGVDELFDPLAVGGMGFCGGWDIHAPVCRVVKC
jgi:hypothetical protein